MCARAGDLQAGFWKIVEEGKQPVKALHVAGLDTNALQRFPNPKDPLH